MNHVWLEFLGHFSHILKNVIHCPRLIISSRYLPVLGQFTMHMVEFIQLNTNQPHVWLEFRHLPSFFRVPTTCVVQT